MPPKWQPPDPQHLIDTYLAGQSAPEIAAQYGVQETTVRKALRGLGVPIRSYHEANQLRSGRPSPRRAAIPDDAIDLYRRGLSTVTLGHKYGVSPGTIANRLREAGVPLRDSLDSRYRSRGMPQPNDQAMADRYLTGLSGPTVAREFSVDHATVLRALRRLGLEPRTSRESIQLNLSRMSVEERKRRFGDPRRGRPGHKPTVEALHRRALSMEGRFTPAHNSPAEATLRGWLAAAEIETIVGKAIGPYNADLGADPVAVEVFGGNHHGSGAHAAVFPKRCRYILDSGWSLVIVWVCRFFPLTTASAEYLVPFIEAARRDESGGSQYRVIGGNGQLLASRDGEFDDFAFVPPGS